MLDTLVDIGWSYTWQIGFGFVIPSYMAVFWGIIAMHNYEVKLHFLKVCV